jgi:hypothetical protein
VGCQGPKVVIFLSPAWVVSHMKRTWEANFCFGLFCKVGCEGPKVVIFLSPAWVVSHVKRTLGANFCFGLVCIVVWKVQKEFYSFISMG